MISLGIDTSCYTSSMVVMEDDRVLFEARKLLTVKKGTVGLRQADAFFQHVHNLPVLYKSLNEQIDLSSIQQVVVSDRPRPLEGSYMPVFTAGMRFAEVVGLSLNIPVKYLSHQENHLYACLLEHPIADAFIGVHISGGTSEILSVDENNHIEIIGETLDLSFGKLIDRMGVYMGLDFPCGKAMDGLESHECYPLKYALKGNDFNLSGVETKLKSFYDQDADIEKVAYTLFNYLAGLLIKVLDKVLLETGYHNIIMSGGVSANSVMRSRLQSYYGNKIKFTSIAYATDHAIGNAYYGNVVKTY